MYSSIHKPYIKELFPLDEWVVPAIGAAAAAGYGLYKGGKKAGEWVAKNHGKFHAKDGIVSDFIKTGKNIYKGLTTPKEPLSGQDLGNAITQTLRQREKDYPNWKSDKKKVNDAKTVKTDKVKEGLSKLIDNQKSESILHYSDAKGTPTYSEGYKAAKDGVKYDENPYIGIKKLQWSRGHNDERADRLRAAGEPNYGARGQFENRETVNEIFSQSQMKQAIGIARKSGGDYTKAYNEIEKIKKGLGDEHIVQNALKRANESIEK
jgi:hypothetical protein